jgi:hypothetical protein
MAYLPRWEWAWQRVKEDLGEAIAVGVLSLIIALGAGMNGAPAAIGAGVGGALLWALIRFSWYAYRLDAPPLVVDYEFVSAPGSFSPGTKSRSIKLDYTEPEPDMVVISFEKTTPMEYRMARRSWCLCTVRNRGGKPLLSAHLVFDSEFFQGEYSTADNVRFKQSIRVLLPFIPVDDKFEFYIMNGSGLNVSVTTPTTAVVQLEGEPHSRTARVQTSPGGRPSGSTLTFYT